MPTSGLPAWVILVCIPLIVAPPSAVYAQANTGQRRVLLISCDGLRPDAIEPAGAQVMLQLIATGSYQATCLNEMPPVTLPNHASMVTGLSVARHGVYANTTLEGRMAATTVFDLATSAGLGVGFFVNKGKLAYLCEEESVSVWRVTGDLDTLTADVVAAIQTEDLHLIYVHFGAPDGAGHREGWMSETYLTTVAAVDAAIGLILDALDAADILDDTVVILTADHGGHANTHFLDIPEDRFIPFILNGPGIAAGRQLCEQVRVMDAAATALHVLGLPTDSATDGKFVSEASTEFTQPECTAPDVGFTGLCGTLSFLFYIPAFVLLTHVARRR